MAPRQGQIQSGPYTSGLALFLASPSTVCIEGPEFSLETFSFIPWQSQV